MLVIYWFNRQRFTWVLFLEYLSHIRHTNIKHHTTLQGVDSMSTSGSSINFWFHMTWHRVGYDSKHLGILYGIYRQMNISICHIHAHIVIWSVLCEYCILTAPSFPCAGLFIIRNFVFSIYYACVYPHMRIYPNWKNPQVGAWYYYVSIFLSLYLFIYTSLHLHEISATKKKLKIKSISSAWIC